MKAITVTASCIALSLLAGSAQAQTPSSFNDLVGARAVGAEAQMQSRGYSLVKTQKGDDRSYTYWWNASSRQCVTVATMDGRYASITSTLAPDCRQRADRRSSSNKEGYRPSPGYTYGNSSSNQRQSPSYVEDRDRGGDRYQVSGQDVDLGRVDKEDSQIA